MDPIKASFSPMRGLNRMVSCHELTHFSDYTNLPKLQHSESNTEPNIAQQADHLNETMDNLLWQITKLTSELEGGRKDTAKENAKAGKQAEEIVKAQKKIKTAPKIMHSPSVRQYVGKRVMITPRKAENPEYKGIIKKQRRTLRIEDFELGKNIGSGKFGDVFQCRHRRTGTLYAIKKIFKSMVLEYGMIDQFTQQIKILYSLNHPNIVKLYGHFDDKYHIFLLMEYLQDGMLMNHLKKGENFVGTIMRQVSRAVANMHRYCIAHRDIKPENILYSNGVAKICDFGWAANCDNRMRKTFCGTLDYVSPEILERREYSLQVDLWSLGVLCYELLFGVAPFNNKPQPNHKPPNDQKLVYPDTISDLAKDFITKMLLVDPDQRMSALQASRHPLTRTHQHPPDALIKEISSILM